MPHNSLAWLDQELSDWDALGLRRALKTRCGPQGAGFLLNGREFINFGANDYLDLASDPRLTEAVKKALHTDSWGSGASPLIIGRSLLHEQLEQRLAEFEGAEAALIFPTGFAANVGAITSLAGRGDIIFSDEKNHASIVDGCRLSGARVQVYPHVDLDYLEKTLAQASGFRRRLIVTDGLFSMDGDLAPVDEIADLATRYQAMLMVDEAHATGVFGENGRGVCEHFSIEQQVDVRIGTFSKAFGSIGGFVVGSEPLIQWLANRARTYVFSTSPPAATCAAALAALEIVEEEPWRRKQLLQRASCLRKHLRDQGWNVGESQSQIIPVIIGPAQLTMQLAESLLERGFFVPGIRPPSVPENQSLLRISVSQGHNEEIIDRLANVFSDLRSKIETKWV